MNKASDRIEISQLCKSFAKHKVLRELDWSIAAGAVVGLLGTNGAGKTTLLQCLLGLLKADSGRHLAVELVTTRTPLQRHMGKGR